MNIPDFENIKPVTILSLRNAILDNKVSEEDAIFLNQYNFDDIVLEYRKEYGTSISIPYYLLGILILEDPTHTVREGNIHIQRNYIKIHEE